MSANEPAASAERLDELTRVTKEQRTYSRTSGLPLAALGCWLLVGTLAGDTVHGRALLLGAPLVWIVAEWMSVRLYSSQGVVVVHLRWLRWMRLALLLWLCWAWVDRIPHAHWYRELVSPELLRAGVIAEVVAVAVAALWSSRRGRYLDGAWIAILAAFLATSDTVYSLIGRRGWFAVMWAGVMVAGIYSHLRFSRLERRIASLSTSSPGPATAPGAPERP